MNIPKITRKIFALILIAVWAVFAFVNLFTNAPLIWERFCRGWDVASKLEGVLDAANGGIVCQNVFQTANGYLTLLLGTQTSNGFSIVKGDNQQLIYTNFYPYETYDYFNEHALRLRELNIAAQKQGTSLLFLNCLDLYSEENNQYGKFPVWNLNACSDAFMYYLQGYGIDYLDARVILKNSELSPCEYRYKTEPHWTTQASFEVYLKLMEKLKTKGEYLDTEGVFTDRTHFSRTMYGQSYVGKLGKRTGIPFSGYDDFVLIAPNFPTDFTMTYLPESNKESRNGDFFAVLFDRTLLDSENPYERDMYSAYLYETYPFRKIKNNLNPNAPKILIVGDSYMLPMTTFLAAAAGEIHLFWPYTFPESEENLVKYIAKNRVDYIVIGFSPMTFYKNGFNFLNGIELPALAR